MAAGAPYGNKDIWFNKTFPRKCNYRRVTIINNKKDRDSGKDCNF
jgi:hypothetical protein